MRFLKVLTPHISILLAAMVVLAVGETASAEGALAEAAMVSEVPPVAPPEKVFCVFTDLLPSEACPAFSVSRAVEIQGVGGETILFVEKESLLKNQKSESQKPERTSIVASSRIEDAVLLEEYDADDAVLLEREVRELSGARYELPNSRAEIKRMVGFPDNAEVAKEDWIEMLRVHAEMAMSLSANASQFILDQMGLVSDPPASARSGVASTSSGALNPVVIEADRDARSF